MVRGVGFSCFVFTVYQSFEGYLQSENNYEFKSNNHKID